MKLDKVLNIGDIQDFFDRAFPLLGYGEDYLYSFDENWSGTLLDVLELQTVSLYDRIKILQASRILNHEKWIEFEFYSFRKAFKLIPESEKDYRLINAIDIAEEYDYKADSYYKLTSASKIIIACQDDANENKKNFPKYDISRWIAATAAGLLINCFHHLANIPHTFQHVNILYENKEGGENTQIEDLINLIRENDTNV